MPPVSNKPADSSAMWRISGMGLELIGGMLGMMAVGWFIDGWQGTGSRWTTIGAVVGLVAGGVNFIRKALALNRAEVAKYKRAHPDGSPKKIPSNAESESPQ